MKLDGAAAAGVLPLQPPWYVDAAHARVGPVDGGVPAALAQQLLCASSAAPNEVAELAARWPAALGEYAAQVPPPPPIRYRRRRDVDPVPVQIGRESDRERVGQCV